MITHWVNRINRLGFNIAKEKNLQADISTLDYVMQTQAEKSQSRKERSFNHTLLQKRRRERQKSPIGGNTARVYIHYRFKAVSIFVSINMAPTEGALGMVFL